MKPISHWLGVIMTVCLLALASSCNELQQETQVTPDQNRAEMEAIAQQYGLKLSTLDPSTKNVIRVSSVQAFRDTLAKYYEFSSPKARQTRLQAFTKSLLAEHLPTNYPAEARAKFDAWNEQRVVRLMKNDPILGDVSRTQEETVGSSSGGDPGSPYGTGTGVPPTPGGTVTYPGGPGGGGGSPGDGGGGSPTPYDGPVRVQESPSNPNNPEDVVITFSFGDVSTGLQQGNNGTPITATVPVLGGSFTPQLVMGYHYKQQSNFIIGATVTVATTGDLNNQIKALPDLCSAYKTADHGFFVKLTMAYTYTLPAVGALGAQVTPQPTTFIMEVSFNINADGSATAPIVKKY